MSLRYISVQYLRIPVPLYRFATKFCLFLFILITKKHIMLQWYVFFVIYTFIFFSLSIIFFVIFHYTRLYEKKCTAYFSFYLFFYFTLSSMTQETALNLMKSWKNIFLTGQAGSGKTYVLNTYIRRCREHEIPIAVTASTGIAATHLSGSTIHSRSGIGIKHHLTDQDVDEIASKSWVLQKIAPARVLIVDEVSMLSAQFLDDIERIVQEVHRDARPRGGMQVIFCGDFFQLPPVSKHGETTRRFAFASKAWNRSDLHFCYLLTQWRQTDTTFRNLLNAMRIGQVTPDMLALLDTRKNADLWDQPYVRLYTHNADVDTINQQHLKELPGKAHSFTASTKWTETLVKGLLKGMLTPDVLTLKEGARVLFTKNNASAGYRNGTMGTVDWWDDETWYPVVCLADETDIVVEPETWKTVRDEETLAQVTQIPLKLARAITVHKSQGMTLDAAEIDLSKSFAHGQSYVALSRLKSLEWLRLLWYNPQWFQSHELVLRGDAYFQQQSAETESRFSELDEEAWSLLHETFVHAMGGEWDSV